MSLLEDIHKEIKECKSCGLHAARTQAVPGAGDESALVMFIGEGPGEKEDKQGLPFVGRAGNLLTDLLNSIGIDRGKVYITNVVKCRPPGNRDPRPEEIEACAEFLEAQIAVIKPKVICTLGRFALKSLVPRPELQISRVHGRPIRFQGLLFMPLFHPAAALHQPRLMKQLEADFVKLRKLLIREGVEF